MKFTLEIGLGNEAMQTAFDIYEALNAVGHALALHSAHAENQDVSSWDAENWNRKILDKNGNTVGYWSIEEN